MRLLQGVGCHKVVISKVAFFLNIAQAEKTIGGLKIMKLMKRLSRQRELIVNVSVCVCVGGE